MDHREDQRTQKLAAAKLQAVLRGRRTREVTDDGRLEYRAAAKLQAVWRAHLAREFVAKLRWQSKSKLQRTFSWNKRQKKTVIKKRSEEEILRGAGVEGAGKPKAVRRSVSFDRFSKGVKSIMSAETKADAPSPSSPAKSKQLLFILLQRGPNGLGLELDATNTVVNMVPGGAADLQGYFREGDTIASVDGIPLRGRLLQDVMDRSKHSYSFDVWRLTPVRARGRANSARIPDWLSLLSPRRARPTVACLSICHPHVRLCLSRSLLRAGGGPARGREESHEPRAARLLFRPKEVLMTDENERATQRQFEGEL